MTQPHVRTRMVPLIQNVSTAEVRSIRSTLDGDTLYGVTLYELLPWNICGMTEPAKPDRRVENLKNSVEFVRSGEQDIDFRSISSNPLSLRRSNPFFYCSIIILAKGGCSLRYEVGWRPCPGLVTLTALGLLKLSRG
jgi:hypothetical protein